MKKPKLLLIILVLVTGVSAYGQPEKETPTNQSLLNELTQLQAQILNDIVQKKTERLEKHLHEHVSLITFQGLKLDKTSFIGFVQSKDVVFESITPSDFQLGYSDSKIAVLTYKELLKFADQPQALNVIVTIAYIKEKGVWKGTAIHATLLQG